MNFQWWWILVAIGAIWATGWLVSLIVCVFFNPLDSEEDKRKDLRGRLLAHAVINWVLWPWLLPGVLKRQKLYRDMRTGKRPGWIILDRTKDEQSSREWTLSDGTKFWASADDGLSVAEPSLISGDYEDDALTGPVEYRVRMVAPSHQPPGEWTRLEFEPRGPSPDPDDEDAVEEYNLTNRYRASVQLPRGKYEIDFRVPNRSGAGEQCSAVMLIVADPEDYNL
ncbi:MAG: hypothetical protein AB1705_18065 [Verrucomicrobiota bacterium]